MNEIRLGVPELRITDVLSSQSKIVPGAITKLMEEEQEKAKPKKAKQKFIPETFGQSNIWNLSLPLSKREDGTKAVSPELWMTAQARLELFCEQFKLSGVEAMRVDKGFNFTIPDKLAPELVNFIRISGACMNKVSPNRKERRSSV